ncbi:MAG TPA: DNA polymerase III subunit alpha, partial [Chloroflexi bacterium]|nr:DNA polymerase III subunit alpha [Chloroflexota bacterium]
LKSEEEMRRVFQPLADMPDSAFTNTLKIAEMCNVDLEDKSYHLPDLPVELMPPGHNYRTFLRKLTDEGLVERYGERVASPEVQERKEHELSIISKMNFDVYFLIVWDLCEYAIRNNIWWNVRGSGAGSIVAYALGITKIDPLKHHLIFERFLNPGRVSMPDFDLDYPDDQREEMIRYTIRRYGEDHVAQIVSFGRMKARAAIRDVGRAQDVSLDEVDRIAKLVPAISGKPVTIDKTLDSESEFYSAELKKRYKTEDHVKKLIDSARSLEGVARHSSVHAAAVIVADKPLVNYVPLMRPQGSVITKSITQFEFPICDSIGLLKIDFLGLSTLTVMRRAAELIKLRHGIEYTLDNIPVEDPKAFELLASGNLTGIFQVEGAGMRRLMSEMQPHKFDHIVAAISLYRPGPMENIPSYIRRMHGKEEVQYHTPDLKPILEDTYGILVYQEQIIRIAAELAGYEPGEADMIRKAVAKKKTALMEKHKIQFTAGALEKGYSQKVIDAIWGDIEYFARYGFNKAHAADYAAITCQTAFLKAHYQVEYMAALMTVEQHKTDKMGMLMEECRMMGIEVFPPSVNHSDAGFIIEETETGPAIHFGMGAVKNVGEGPIETIIAGREEQPFRDIDDFSQRVDLRKVGKRALESLIKVGALQDFGKRYILLALTERMIRLSGQIHRAAAEGQMSMFDMGGFDTPSVGSIMYPLPDAPEIPRKELLGWEKELMGIYLSSHPIQPHMEAIKQVTTCLCGDLSELRDGRQVRVAGLITKIRQMTTKKGDPMAFVEIEDVQSSLEVVVFPRTYKDYQHLLVPDSIIVVAGKVDGKDEDRPKILADTISTELTVHQPLASEPADAFAESRAAYATPDNGGLMQSAPPPPPSPLPETAPPDAPHWVTPPTQKEPPTLSKPLEITLLPGDNLAADKLKLQNVLNILRQHPGNSRFVLYIPRNGQRIPIEFPQLQISYTVHLHKELEALVGATGVRAQE